MGSAQIDSGSPCGFHDRPVIEKLSLEAPPGLPPPLPTAGSWSVGAAEHGSGECRPCAWYWKPGSCSNGQDCMHCHLCPEDELKTRKKTKLTNLRNTSKLQGDTSMPGPVFGAMVGLPLMELPQVGPLGMEFEFLQEDGMEPLEGIAEIDLPSSGSALHALGKCKPCAWFWKPGGCSNGKECCHCHLCPRGELKDRRKAKEIALRVGALVPKKVQPVASINLATSRATNVLKILPLI